MDDYQVYEMNEPSESPNSKTNMGCGTWLRRVLYEANIGCFTWVFGILGILVLIAEIAKLAYD